MDPTLVPGTRFEFLFQICGYEHTILHIYIIIIPTIGIRAKLDNELWMFIGMNPNNLCRLRFTCFIINFSLLGFC